MPMAYSKVMSHSQPVAPAYVREAHGEEVEGRDDDKKVHGAPLQGPSCTAGASRFPQAGSGREPPHVALRKRLAGAPVQFAAPLPGCPSATGRPFGSVTPRFRRSAMARAVHPLEKYEGSDPGRRPIPPRRQSRPRPATPDDEAPRCRGRGARRRGGARRDRLEPGIGAEGTPRTAGRSAPGASLAHRGRDEAVLRGGATGGAQEALPRAGFVRGAVRRVPRRVRGAGAPSARAGSPPLSQGALPIGTRAPLGDAVPSEALFEAAPP